jgi:hypothetical protein
MHVVAEFAQARRDDTGRAHFLEANFRMRVQVTPRRDRFVDDALR